MTREQLLEKALTWALANGVTVKANGKLRDSGCGCCSDPLEPPSDLVAIIEELRPRGLDENPETKR